MKEMKTVLRVSFRARVGSEKGRNKTKENRRQNRGWRSERDASVQQGSRSGLLSGSARKDLFVARNSDIRRVSVSWLGLERF